MSLSLPQWPHNHDFSSILPWLTSLLFLSLIINWPLVLRCVICLPDLFVPLLVAGGQHWCPCPWLPGYWFALLPVSAFIFPFSKHCHPPISSFPILLVIIFIYSRAYYSWHVDRLQLSAEGSSLHFQVHCQNSSPSFCLSLATFCGCFRGFLRLHVSTP